MGRADIAMIRARRALCGASVVVSASLASCEPPPAEAQVLRLTQVRPKNLDGVALNEPIVLHFSDELDRVSVGHASFRLRSLDGRVARGTRYVDGNRLTFVPEPVLARDLSDGGYLPGTTYRIELAGFPRPEGLRARNGAYLEHGVAIEFRTVSASDEAQLRFLDTTPTEAQFLKLQNVDTQQSRFAQPQVTIGQTSGFFLEGGEPIDPATVPRDYASGFELTAHGSGEVVPLRAVLRENDDPGAWPPRGTTILQLVPERPLEVYTGRRSNAARYQLRVDLSRVPLRDFGGNPMWVVVEQPRGQVRPLQQINVVVRAAAEARSEGSYLEEFVGVEQRSSAVVADADGTAHWSGNGRVEVRYPRSAGSGAAGEVALSGIEQRRDLHATRLEVPEHASCRLSSEPGLVVLRSQGKLSVAGKLSRDAPGEPLRFEGEESVEDCLARWREAGTTATVLIAGGDLWIRGEIEVAGPLILVAGGRVRVSGSLDVCEERREAGYFARVGDAPAAGLWVYGENESDSEADPKPIPLRLEPPSENPLVRPLRLAVRSNPIPIGHSGQRWRPAPEVHGYAGKGAFAVQYLGERPRADDPSRYEEFVREDPSLLLDSSALRLWVELEVNPGAVWDPPWVDSVRVTWDIPEE